MPGALKPLGAGWEERLVKAAPPFSIELAASTREKLRTWLDLLAGWNAKVDLTAARSSDELVDLMVADACLLASETPSRARVVDVGTGAGAPGLALGFLRPDLEITLVEPAQKRVAFLRTVLGSVSARNVKVLRDRGEDLAGGAARFDVAVARATLPPPAWLALGSALVADAGSVWVLLARDEAPELAGWRAALDREYVWPLT